MASAVPSHAGYEALGVFPSLDGLRCLCIVAVVFHHTRDVSLDTRLSTRGFLGVDLFFVISGFLIATLLLREQKRTGEISLCSFYLRRALRIMPLYYAVIALCGLVYSTVSSDSADAPRFFAELPYHLSFTTNWVPVTTLLAITWSLSAEEQFYALFPPLQKYVKRPVRVLLVLLVLSQVVHFGLADPWLAYLGQGGPDDLLMLRRTTFTPILLGVLLAHLLHAPSSFRVLSRLLGSRAAAPLLFAALLAGLALLPLDLRGYPRLLVHLLMALLLASTVVRVDHGLSRLLELRPVARLGAISYGMYLWHMLARDAVTRFMAPAELAAVWLFPLTLLLSVIMAELSYRHFEAVFLRWKERVRDAGLFGVPAEVHALAGPTPDALLARPGLSRFLSETALTLRRSLSRLLLPRDPL